MAEFESVEDVCTEVKRELDAPLRNGKSKKVSILYANNASGKTRLSKLFYDNNEESVLYYSAFTEDLFTWDNESFELKVNTNEWIFKFIQEQGLDRQIVNKFQQLTGSKLEPVFNLTPDKTKEKKEESKGTIVFEVASGDTRESIKISKGEEGVFIWAIFSTILDLAVETLNEASIDNRSTEAFNAYQYIVIDDPVSSMDDTRIITVALDIIRLINESKSQLKFIITTHHALFFNVLFNTRNKKWDKKSYVLSKSGAKYFLKNQGTNSPFAYHHVVISEISEAIKASEIKKYHFNLFRALLEKTANFLGYDQWQKLLEAGEHSATFKKLIDHYSHNSLSDLEPKDLSTQEIGEFKDAITFFLKEFKWQARINE